jgi:hypothetical protein
MIRNTLGASNTLLVEWKSEDLDKYKNHLRMSREQFFELLSKVKPYTEKQDTNMRECISAYVKLQITLRYLAAGDSFGSLEALSCTKNNDFEVSARSVECHISIIRGFYQGKKIIYVYNLSVLPQFFKY